MPECHNCLTFLNPSYRTMPWEKTPCAKCKLSDDNHKGRSHVSVDSSEAVVAEISLALESEQADQRTEKLAGFIRQFMSLPSVTRDIVAFRFTSPEQPLSVIATRHRITVQAAHSRLKKALERFPVLCEVINMRTRESK